MSQKLAPGHATGVVRTFRFSSSRWLTNNLPIGVTSILIIMLVLWKDDHLRSFIFSKWGGVIATSLLGLAYWRPLSPIKKSDSLQLRTDSIGLQNSAGQVIGLVPFENIEQTNVVGEGFQAVNQAMHVEAGSFLVIRLKNPQVASTRWPQRARQRRGAFRQYDLYVGNFFDTDVWELKRLVDQQIKAWRGRYP